MAEFKKGDVVQLKSGGPSMTITTPRAAPGAKVLCVWFAGAKRQQASFDPEILELVPEKKKKD